MSKEDSENELDQETFGCASPDDGDSFQSSDNQCDICRSQLCSPRVLSCLHVFCEGCLQTLLDGGVEDGKKELDQISCPTCTHKTKMGGKPVSSLLMAFVSANILDMEGVRAMTVVCTSCKSADKAVARCADCANFLCPSCNTAHQVMRCFENHRVLALEELKESKLPIPIHKPVACNVHPNETVKFFCNTCQVPACSECITEHKLKEHAYARASEADGAVRNEIRSLVEKAKDREQASEEACVAVVGALTELEAQHDNAKSLIEETFQSYKAVLESARDRQLDQLKKLHNERELAAMEKFKGIEMALPHLQMAIDFAKTLIELGDAAEVLTSYRVVRDRLTNLLEFPLDPAIDVRFEFQTNLEQFTEAVEKHFGSFKTAKPAKSDSPVPNPNPISPPPVPLSLGVSFIDTGKDSRNSASSMVSSLLSSTISIPTSGIMSSGGGSPTSLKSSCDSDLSASISSSYLGPGLDISTPPLSQAQNSMSGLNPMVEYNLQRLAMEMDAEPQFCIDDFLSDFTNNHAVNNLHALAKLDATNGSIGDGPSSNLLGPVQNGLNLGVNGGHYPNMSTQTSPVIPEYNNMNGYHGMNMNGFHAMNGMSNNMNGMSAMNGSLSPMNNVSGMNPMSPSVISTMSGLSPFPTPRQSTPNTTSMSVRYKYGQLGNNKGQFNSPHGFCLGNDEEVIVADTNNHRIQIFEKDGSFKYQFGTSGRDEGQLWYPRKVAIMKKCGKFVVCDRGNERSRMQIFTKNGHFVRKIGVRYIDIVAGLAVTSDGLIVAVDSVSPTVFVLSEQGKLIKWFDCSNYMREPSDIAISGDEYYVCDFKGHCVVVFNKEGTFVRRIGREGLTNFPNGIDVSDAGDVLVGDSHGNRFHVTVFNRQGQVLSDVECPYVKVSRCCGLKLTSEGLIVTLAKNNHHVLILSTIFVQ